MPALPQAVNPRMDRSWRMGLQIMGNLQERQVTILLLVATIYFGIQSARLITQPTRSNK